MLGPIKRISVSILLCMVLLASFITPADAQTQSAVVTLADLGKSEVKLVGPFDTSTLTFGWPANWKVNSPGQITLDVSTTFNTVTLSKGQYSIGGGVLTISFNRKTVTAIVLEQIQAKEYVIDVPADYMLSARTDGLMELSFSLDSGISCYADQQTTVVIGSDSRIAFSYDEILPDTNLVNFPYPLYQKSIFPDSAYIIVPEKPSSAELQSALAVAAGLGSLTASSLSVDLLTVAELTPEKIAASHLIFVGKAPSISQFGGLILPFPAVAGQFQLTGPDYGVVEMVNSPWSRSHVILVVSGNTDAGLTRAAQAISTGILISNVAPNVAIIEDVQSTNPASSSVSDRTLADMGFNARQFTSRGLASNSYSFIVPSGSTVSSDAFFELAYGHSALLNYDLSGMVVLLNGTPIGSVRFTDETSKQAINRARITIPPSLIFPGRNSLEIRANLNPIDNCVDPGLRGLYVVVWPESRLYLPFTPSRVDLTAGMDLGQYPSPMIFNTSLADTAFIFSRANPESWRSGLQIASYLGDRANGTISQPRVFFDDEADSADLSTYHLIVIGRPSQLTMIGKLADVMPVPFEKNTDVANNQYSQIIYELPKDAPIGYLELFQSPWNSDKVVIAVLGNNPKGEAWAASALVDAALRSQLAGNFAVINGTHVQTVDTRLTIPVKSYAVIPDQPGQTATPSVNIDETPKAAPPAWIVPVLVSSALLLLILIVVVVLINRRRTKMT